MWQARSNSRAPVTLFKNANHRVVVSAWTAFAYIYRFPSWIWKEWVVPLFSSVAFSWPRMHPADAQKTWTRGSRRTDADTRSPVGKTTLHLYVQTWHWFYKVVGDGGWLPRREQICTQTDLTPFGKQSDCSLWLHNTNKRVLLHSLSLCNFKQNACSKQNQPKGKRGFKKTN